MSWPVYGHFDGGDIPEWKMLYFDPPINRYGFEEPRLVHKFCDWIENFWVVEILYRFNKKCFWKKVDSYGRHSSYSV